MSSSPNLTSGSADKPRTIEIVNRTLAKRYRAERRFRLYGMLSILLAMVALAVLFVSIIAKGASALQQTYIQLDIEFSEEILGVVGDREPTALHTADFGGLIKAALRKTFPDVKRRAEKRKLYELASPGAAFQLRDMVLADPSLIGQTRSVWVTADDEVDMLVKGHSDRDAPPSERRVSDQMIGWVDQLEARGAVKKRFNLTFFTAGDSREPELAGIWGATIGSFYALVVTLLLSFPIGVAAAIYLEEFAPKNRWTDLIEININNLAAVPSIVFGLLGLAVFINFFGLPRSAPVVGGLVLTLMTLPTIIIAGRAAIMSVPPSIREAALGVGASRVQAILHHILPLALPGMLTGTIIGMARALGESAPLLMIGMVAFIVDIPEGFFDPATALPVQIYLWADSPERAFVERTAAATLVLLLFMAIMNATAVLLRKRFERRW